MPLVLRKCQTLNNFCARYILIQLNSSQLPHILNNYIGLTKKQRNWVQSPSRGLLPLTLGSQFIQTHRCSQQPFNDEQFFQDFPHRTATICAAPTIYLTYFSEKNPQLGPGQGAYPGCSLHLPLLTLPPFTLCTCPMVNKNFLHSPAV